MNFRIFLVISCLFTAIKLSGQTYENQIFIIDKYTREPLTEATVIIKLPNGAVLDLKPSQIESGYLVFELDCNVNYAIDVNAPGYFTAHAETGTNEVCATLVNQFELAPSPTHKIEFFDFATDSFVVGGNFTVDPPILFDPITSNVLPESLPILDSVASFLLRHRELEVELRVHCDSRVSDDQDGPLTYK